MDLKALYNLSYGVYVTATLDKGRPVGCVTNSVMQVTASPATVAVSVNHDNFTNRCIQENGYFSVSILTTQASPAVIGTFGFSSSKHTDKFENIPYRTVQGIPVLQDCCGYIVCRVMDKMESSTHTVFLGEVVDAGGYTGDEPMTYAYYHNVIKGKSPKNAPTYVPEDSPAPAPDAPKGKNTTRWVCSICGYVYEGDKLPEGFVCPICGQPASAFVKQEP